MVKVDLSNKTAIVTGAAKGMGKVIAETLAKCGAAVMVSDVDEENARKTADEIVAMGFKADAIRTDVTNAADVDKLVNTTIERFGGLDILVNNAGVSRNIAFMDVEEKEWDRVFNVNVKGVYLCTRAAAAHMIKQKSGKIVNLASMVGKEAFEGFVHYSASKFAVIGLTQGCAKEFAPYDINVNAVCPGVVRTPLWDPLLDQMSERMGITREEAFKDFTAPIPLKRPQEPQDIANMVAFLSSDLAKNITGQSINVTGGQIMH